MITLMVTFTTMLIAIIMTPYLYMSSTPPVPEIDREEWWGPADLKNNVSTAKRPFTVNFTDAVIQRIRSRIAKMRPVTPSLEGAGFTYGFNSAELPKWLNYWHDSYNFSARQDFLNQYPQYLMNVQGIDIHFIEATPQASSNVEVLTLLLLHGWPGSVREFYETIGYLTAVSSDRDYIFKVIAPSLVGFGFSGRAVRPGLGADKMAIVFSNMMKQLGHKKYYVHGDDFGSLVAKDLVTYFPKEVIGLHIKLPFLITPMLFLASFINFTYPAFFYNFNLQNDSAVVPKSFAGPLERTGYLHEQATKPDTIGAALTDCSGGLMAYVLEKFATGSRDGNRARTDGGLSDIWTKDQLLDNVMYYACTNTMAYAIRLYAETFDSRYFLLNLDQIPTSVPTVALATRSELMEIPFWALKAKFTNVLNHTMIENVGHFLAFEKPKLFADTVFQGVGLIRKWHTNNPTA